jgi:PAS domain S-box-containing protein
VITRPDTAYADDLRALLRAVASSATLPDALTALCRWVERAETGSRCSVLLVDEEAGVLRPGAAPSLPDAFVESSDGLPIGPTSGSCGTAAFRRERVVCDDLATDPLWAAATVDPLAYGLRACWSTPILAGDGRVLGTFAVYGAVPGVPDVNDEQLLDDAARIAALVIERAAADSRQRQQAEALAASEAWYRLLLEEQGDIVTVIDLDGTVRYSSPAVTRVLGYPSEGRGGFSLFSLVHPDDVGIVQAHARRLAETPGVRMTLTGRYRHADGSYRWMDVAGRRVDLPGGGPVLILTSRDVTERETAMAEALESRRFTERILQAIPDVVYTFDLAERRITFVTPSCEQVVGLRADEVVAMGARIWPELVHPDDLPALIAYASTWRDVEGAILRGIEYRIRDRRGGWRWVVQRSIVLSRGPDGTPATTLGVMQDVTERRRAELRLRQAERMESLGQLAGGIAHDFNNLLAVILHASELLEPALAADPALAEANADVLAAARRARELVRGILTFSRMHEPARTPFHLEAVVREGLRFFDATRPPDLAVDVSLGAQPCRMVGDPAQLQQVVLNLCANAEYAMRGRDGARLAVSLDRRRLDAADASPLGLPAGDYALLAVRDTGAGMREEVRQRVFEPFFTTKPVGEGTGMGMAVTHGVVHAHGGAIQVHSVPDAGTTVEVWLPLLGDAQATGAGAGTPHVVPAAEESTAGLRVLLVDDEPAVVRVLGRLLSSLGHQVATDTDAARALDRVRAAPSAYDVVITDQSMPGLAGDALARALREVRADLPVILCSGYSERYQADDAERDGLLGFLGKPIDRDRLVALLRRVRR